MRVQVWTPEEPHRVIFLKKKYINSVLWCCLLERLLEKVNTVVQKKTNNNNNNNKLKYSMLYIYVIYMYVWQIFEWIFFFAYNRLQLKNV